ncbi:hypothetical protein ACHAXA_002903 [Cyclostephanos tholiformis]|uniref:Spindle assembly abnormal protein 6 N-terminal domain-containing protein n=1 Tax=Cyclostephanos tholiformis TaxID=382380 RepID=A0ABD3SG85_9STRA
MTAIFDRENPLFERNNVPFEVVSSSSTHGSNTAFGGGASVATNKRRENFTVRILRGHRSQKKSSGEKEHVIRFEISDEFNLIDDFPDGSSGCMYGIPNTPTIPIIHAPFMTADRGQRQSTMQVPSHQNLSASGGHKVYPKESSHIPSRPIELFELEVGESDFSDLRRDQALLVDFHDFANSLISLMQFCEVGDVDSEQPREQCVFRGNINDVNEHANGWNRQKTQPMGQQQWGNNNGVSSTPSQTQQQVRASNQPLHGRMMSPYGKLSYAMPISTYSCRLETDSIVSSDEGVQWKNNPKSTSIHHARFSIVEANNFRELTHVALNLNVGSDKSVRLYLSSRLNQIMMQTRVAQSLCAEHQRRSDSAETEVIGLKKMLNELTQSSVEEKRHILHQSEELLRTVNSSRSQEVNEVTAAKDAEIKALTERSEKDRSVLENKVRLLEDINAKINIEKTAYENENERLATKLSFHETTNSTLANELSSVRSKLEQVLDEKTSTEKSLHQLQLQLSSLEYSHGNKEKALSQTEADRISAEKISANAKRTLSSQHSQMEDLRRSLEEAQLDASKYKNLTSRYQTNRLEMKKRLNEKVKIIREQEDILVVKEKETSELRVQVRELEEKFQRTQSEKVAASRELNDALRQIKEDETKLENNKQVIAWLNKQLSSGGAVRWQGGTIATSKTEFPTPVATAPSRYMPSSVTSPHQQSYVTPDIRAVAGLHPGPTPYSRIPRIPGTADMKM